MKHPVLAASSLFIAAICFPSGGVAQTETVPVGPAANPSVASSLHEEVSRLDDAMSTAFNAHDVRGLMALFAADLEFYHDTGGKQSYADVSQGFEKLLSKPDGMRRELVPESLEVYPIKGYGAIEVGAHKFCHEESGRTECGTFRFLHVWRLEDGEWKVVRVVSYGH